MLVGGIGAVFASTAAAPVAIAGIAVFLHQRRVEQQAEQEKLSKGEDNKNGEEKTQKTANILASLKAELGSIQLALPEQVSDTLQVQEFPENDVPLAPPMEDDAYDSELSSTGESSVPISSPVESKGIVKEKELDAEMKEYMAQQSKNTRAIAAPALLGEKDKGLLSAEISGRYNKLKKVAVEEISTADKLNIAGQELKKLLAKKETQSKQVEQRREIIKQLEIKVQELIAKAEKAENFVKDAKQELQAKKEEIKNEMNDLELKKKEKEAQVLQLVERLQQKKGSSKIFVG